jgi:hypothetical protein
MNHRDRAVHQVPQPPGQLSVRPLDESVEGEVRIPDARHLAQQPPPHRIRPHLLDQLRRIRRGATGLADLASVDREVVVHQNLRGQRQAR